MIAFFPYPSPVGGRWREATDEGSARAKVGRYTRVDDFYEADAEVLADDAIDKVEVEALARSVASEFESYVKLNKKISPEVVTAVGQIDDYAKLADTVASHLAVKISDKQDVLELTSIGKRLEKCLGLQVHGRGPWAPTRST